MKIKTQPQYKKTQPYYNTKPSRITNNKPAVVQINENKTQPYYNTKPSRITKQHEKQLLISDKFSHYVHFDCNENICALS